MSHGIRIKLDRHEYCLVWVIPQK